MYTEFNTVFEIGKQFESQEAMKEVIISFWKKYNVVFSIKDSHPKRGEFNYICKHGGVKRIKSSRNDQTEPIETIDLNTNESPMDSSKDKEPYKKKYSEVRMSSTHQKFQF